MMAAFHLGEVIPESWYCASWLTGTLDGTKVALMLLVTPVLFLLTSPNVCCEKRLFHRATSMFLCLVVLQIKIVHIQQTKGG